MANDSRYLEYLTISQLPYRIRAMAKKQSKLSDQIRQAIEACGKTRYKVSQDTGIDQATLCRFMGGKGGLSIPILDTLGQYLRLRIVADKPQSTRKASRSWQAFPATRLATGESFFRTLPQTQDHLLGRGADEDSPNDQDARREPGGCGNGRTTRQTRKRRPGWVVATT